MECGLERGQWVNSIQLVYQHFYKIVWPPNSVKKVKLWRDESQKEIITRMRRKRVPIAIKTINMFKRIVNCNKCWNKLENITYREAVSVKYKCKGSGNVLDSKDLSFKTNVNNILYWY